MEGMIMRKKPTFCNNPTSTPPALGIQKNSYSVAKNKPKIRIIHIFAPEIIKTDAANFRELVQRLTGKPAESSCKKKPGIPRRRDETRASVSEREMEPRERVNKEEENMWQGENSGGFLGGFSDLDGFNFMQEFGEFPLFPLDSSHTQATGEAHQQLS